MFHIKIVVSLFLCYSQRQWTPGYIYVVTFHTLLAYNYYGKRKEVSNSVTPPIQFADMFPVVDVAGYGVLFVTANPTLLFVHDITGGGGGGGARSPQFMPWDCQLSTEADLYINEA